MYQLTVKALFVEAAALVVCGFLVGLIYDSWKAVIVAQGLLWPASTPTVESRDGCIVVENSGPKPE
jgi:hypothetical protein